MLGSFNSRGYNSESLRKEIKDMSYVVSIPEGTIQRKERRPHNA